jgi:hypothetical protein
MTKLSTGFSYDEPIDPDNPGNWVLVSDNEWFRVWELDQDNCLVRKTECKGTETVLESNRELLKDSDGQRWGDGKIAARVPMNVWFSSGLAEANKQRDYKYMKKFYNDSDHRKYRTFKGRI